MVKENDMAKAYRKQIVQDNLLTNMAYEEDGAIWIAGYIQPETLGELTTRLATYFKLLGTNAG